MAGFASYIAAGGVIAAASVGALVAEIRAIGQGQADHVAVISISYGSGTVTGEAVGPMPPGKYRVEFRIDGEAQTSVALFEVE